MFDIQAIWADRLGPIKESVTGVGVWAALNAVVPVVFEDGIFVMGLGADSVELSGHLRVPQVKRSIEDALSEELEQRVELKVIGGTTLESWETEKKRASEKRRLQEIALERARSKKKIDRTWDGIYEQLARTFAATKNRSLPQNRAKFLLEAVDVLSNALVETPITDDLSERSYARCIERVAQYTELPSALVAVKVLDRTFKG
jgi:hypothetical protein